MPEELPSVLTPLTTDKPLYQPGEVVHFRSLTLERHSLRPVVQEEFRLLYTLTTPTGHRYTTVPPARGRCACRRRG